MSDCPTCGRKLETYYGLWCPVCDKPKRKQVETLNLIQALRHIEVTYDRPGYKDRMWKLLIDMDVIRENDSLSVWIPYPDNTDPNSELSQDVELFAKVFDINTNDGIILRISW